MNALQNGTYWETFERLRDLLTQQTGSEYVSYRSSSFICPSIMSIRYHMSHQFDWVVCLMICLGDIPKQQEEVYRDVRLERHRR